MRVECSFEIHHKSLVGKMACPLLQGPIKGIESKLIFSIRHLDKEARRYITVWEIEMDEINYRRTQPDYSIVNADTNIQKISVDINPIFVGNATLRLYFLQLPEIKILDSKGNDRTKIKSEGRPKYNTPLGTPFFSDKIIIHPYKDALISIFAIMSALGAISEIASLINPQFSLYSLYMEVLRFITSYSIISNGTVTSPLI